ncbi:hypothetical protein N9734_00910 [Alphaproteobacteria bacterium]|nr:hypothetical protein [Alphaproteobacteria bacterium]
MKLPTCCAAEKRKNMLELIIMYLIALFAFVITIFAAVLVMTEFTAAVQLGATTREAAKAFIIRPVLLALTLWLIWIAMLFWWDPMIVKLAS